MCICSCSVVDPGNVKGRFSSRNSFYFWDHTHIMMLWLYLWIYYLDHMCNALLKLAVLVLLALSCYAKVSCCMQRRWSKFYLARVYCTMVTEIGGSMNPSRNSPWIHYYCWEWNFFWILMVHPCYWLRGSYHCPVHVVNETVRATKSISTVDSTS